MSKPKTFHPWNPEQPLLLPPSPVDWLPEHHRVLYLLDLAADWNCVSSMRSTSGGIRLGSRPPSRG